MFVNKCVAPTWSNVAIQASYAHLWMNPGVHTKRASWLLQTVWGEICEQKRFINNGVTWLINKSHLLYDRPFERFSQFKGSVNHLLETPLPLRLFSLVHSHLAFDPTTGPLVCPRRHAGLVGFKHFKKRTSIFLF